MRSILSTLLLAFVANVSFAQSFASPVEYIEYFNKEFILMQELQIEYSSFLVHTRSDVAEQKRLELIASTQKIHDRFSNMKAYQDDKGIKKNAVNVLEDMLKIGNTNYAALAKEKEGCAECFAAVLAEDELTHKDTKHLGKQMDLLVKSVDDFAKANKVELTDDNSSHESLLGKINRINAYLRQLDLATLEVQYADQDIINALNENNPAKAKEEIKTMIKAAGNALKRLKKVERISEDNTTFGMAEKMVNFYKDAAKKLYPDMVSAYDKKGNVINEKVDLYNKTIQRLTNGAANATLKYQTAKLNLQQRHIPKPKEKVSRS